MLQPAFPSRPRAVAIGTVLLLHLLLLLMMSRLGAWSDRERPGPEAVPLVVRLWWPRVEERAAPPAPKPVRPADDRKRAVSRPAAAPAAAEQMSPPQQAQTAEPAARQTPDDAATLSSIPPTAPALRSVPASSAEASTGPLDLRLPRGPNAAWRARTPALDDPRANTARASFQSRLSDALGGSGEWIEERLGPDRIRFRRGDTCVDVERGRQNMLDPYNRASFSRPWIAGGPSKC